MQLYSVQKIEAENGNQARRGNKHIIKSILTKIGIKLIMQNMQNDIGAKYIMAGKCSLSTIKSG
jgi:hypothetical protein